MLLRSGKKYQNEINEIKEIIGDTEATTIKNNEVDSTLSNGLIIQDNPIIKHAETDANKPLEITKSIASVDSTATIAMGDSVAMVDMGVMVRSPPGYSSKNDCDVYKLYKDAALNACLGATTPRTHHVSPIDQIYYPRQWNLISEDFRYDLWNPP